MFVSVFVLLNVKKCKNVITKQITLDVVFSRLNGYAHAFSLSCNSKRYAQSSFGLLSQGYFEQKPLYLEETTSTVLSVLLLIYGKSKQADVSKFKKEFVDGNLKVFTQVFLPLCRK